MTPAVINTFRPFDSFSSRETGYRDFKIENAEGVIVHGCLKIDELRLDGMVIPPFIDERVLSDTTRVNYHDVRIKLYDLIETAGGPTVIRSTKSNNGMWQIGSTLSIKGNWEDVGDGYDDMTMKEIVEIGKTYGIAIPKSGMSKIDAIAEVRKARDEAAV